MDAMPMEKTQEVIRFALEQLEHFEFGLDNEYEWEIFLKFFEDITEKEWR